MWFLNFIACEEGREASFIENIEPPTDVIDGDGINNATDQDNTGKLLTQI